MAGPGSNQTGAGSNKNTLLNKYSKTTPYGATSGTPSPADPATYGGYAATIMGLQQRLAAAQALAQQTVGQAKADFGLAKQAAKVYRVEGTAAAEGDALNRGIVGGSTDLGARSAVIAETAAQRQAALAAKRSTVAGARLDQLSAVGDYYTGMGAAQADLANTQAMQNIQRYQADAFDTMSTNFNKFRQALLDRMSHRVKPGVNTPAPAGINPVTGGPYYFPPGGRPGYSAQQR